jgi:hypothetical protein
MLRIVTVLVYLVVLVPAGWLIWHFAAALPVAVRLAAEGAFLLGLADGRRRRRARKLQTFRDFAG